MKKTLMHKDTEVAVFSCKSNGEYNHLVEVKEEALLPDRTREYDIATKRWMLTRKQSSRINEFSEIRRFYGSDLFVSRNLRSMFDCYWIKDEDNPEETWASVNPHEVWDATSDSLFMMMYKPADFDGVDDSSPNLTISGTVPLLWYEFDEPGLINERAQADVTVYREAKAHNLLDIVEKREYRIVAGRVFSFRRTDVSEDIERIPFDIYYNMSEDRSLSKSENIAKCCMDFGIPDWERFISGMIELDRICGKTDRDLCDIGILRNADTLECIRFDKL